MAKGVQRRAPAQFAGLADASGVCAATPSVAGLRASLCARLSSPLTDGECRMIHPADPEGGSPQVLVDSGNPRLASLSEMCGRQRARMSLGFPALLYPAWTIRYCDFDIKFPPPLPMRRCHDLLVYPMYFLSAFRTGDLVRESRLIDVIPAEIPLLGRTEIYVTRNLVAAFCAFIGLRHVSAFPRSVRVCPAKAFNISRRPRLKQSTSSARMMPRLPPNGGVLLSLIREYGPPSFSTFVVAPSQAVRARFLTFRPVLDRALPQSG